MEYDAFVDLSNLREGETVLCIRSLAPGRKKYRTMQVKALVARARESLAPGQADVLWLRDTQSGELNPEPWFIRVEEARSLS